MTVFKAKNYRDFIETCLKRGKEKIPRGVIKETAEILGCHSTFISQVLHQKADFSHEHAIRFCAYQQLPEEESEFFVDLLNRDRASDNKTRLHFQKIIDRKKNQRMSLQNRSKIPTSIDHTQEPLYLNSWVPSAVHAAIHIDRLDSPTAISRYLNIELDKTLEVLAALKTLGLASQRKSKWRATKKSLHIGRDSILSTTYHSMWRTKTANELLSRRRSLDKIHFSSVFAITAETAAEIRERLVDELETTRALMSECESNELHALCVDFYSLNS